MATRTCVPAVLLVVTLLGCVLARADEPVKAEDKEAPKAVADKASSGEEIAQWIRQLDADEFSDREAAQAKLAGAGKAAAAELAKAAAGDSLEATVRAIDLLKKLYQSPDQSARDAAKQALKTVAKSDRPAAARRAEQILNPAPKPTDANAGGMGGLFFGGGGGGLGIIQGNIQVVTTVVGGAKKMSVKTVNGVRDIEAEENGKTVKIHDDPQQGIKIEATSKKDGKDVTEKYEAKNAEELKKKHPEGYKLYEQYGKNQGQAGQVQIQLGVGGLGGNLQLAPAGPVPAPAPPPAATAPVEAPRTFVPPPGGPPPVASIDKVTALIEVEIKRLNDLLEDYAKEAPLGQLPKEMKDPLREQIRELKQRLTQIEKRLGAKEQKPAEKTHP